MKALFPTARFVCLMAVLVMTGCSFGPSRSERLADHLEAATQAIQAADLERAKVEIAAAAEDTRWDRDRERVGSLAFLVAGSEAMMRGDARLAGAYWSNIEDEALKAQVAAKSQRLGVTVADEPVAVPLPAHHDGRVSR
ncbi:hypothetical protein [Mucisphaera sp.]|uniref:hypothetical protein n=1 Tax=Mucisphaera sp. TaxID=2913024 RepID=UPI003D12FD9B